MMRNSNPNRAREVLIALAAATAAVGITAVGMHSWGPGPTPSRAATAAHTTAAAPASSVPPAIVSPTMSSAASSAESSTAPTSGLIEAPSGRGLPAAARVVCPPATTTVHTAAELTAALAHAAPGDVIALANGVYQGNFTATRSGTTASPIFLCGGPGAVLDGGGIKSGYVLHLAPAEHWRIVGFTVRNGQKGVVADGTTGSVIQGLTVENIGDEGIHLRSASTSNLVIGNTVQHTGLRRAKFGEGIYVGSAVKNWPKYGENGGPDRSDHNLVTDNTISDTTAENVDIKEGTTGGAVIGNTFDGTGMTAADSWVDVKGNNWLIAGNVGQHAPQDGFQTHSVADGWGRTNVFRGNVANVDGPGYGFHLAPVDDNVVACDNKANGAAKGLANVPCQ